MNRSRSSLFLSTASALALMTTPSFVDAQQSPFSRYERVDPRFQKVVPPVKPVQQTKTLAPEKLKNIGKVIKQISERPASVKTPSRTVFTPPPKTYNRSVVSLPIQPRAESRPQPRPAPLATIPIQVRPTETYRPAPKVADVADMVAILRGKAPAVSSTISAKPKVVTKERLVPVNPIALPKGMGTEVYMKKGKSPAKSDGGGSGTMYRKKGKTPAESEPDRGVPVVVRIKDGRPQAESTPPTTFISGPSSQDSRRSRPAASSGGYSAAPSIAYRVDSTSALSTNSVKFRKGSTELADPASYQYLSQLAAALRDPSLANDRFVVEGHASAEGSDSSNLVLSQRRSNAIFDFLISQGVRESNLLSVGHGEYQARYRSNDPEYLRAQDRQVIVFKLAE